MTSKKKLLKRKKKKKKKKQSLSSLLEGGSICISERGDLEELERHPNFRLFGCMNPPDIGKKQLTASLANRFTEYYVDELLNKQDLSILVTTYINKFPNYHEVVDDIVKFYLDVRTVSDKSFAGML